LVGATLDETWARKPHGCRMVVRWHLSNDVQEIWNAINFDQKLILEHGDSHWKANEDKKTMVPSRRGIEIIEKK
jgi:hypothetical protein